MSENMICNRPRCTAFFDPRETKVADGQSRNLTSFGKLEELLLIEQLDEFVKASYLTILGREVDSRSLVSITRRFRFWPFSSRRRFLRKLLTSNEHWQNLRFERQQLELTRQKLVERHQAVDKELLEIRNARETFEFHRQVVEKEKIDSRNEHYHWQAIETQILAEHSQLLAVDRPDQFVRDAYQKLIDRLPTDQELATSMARLEFGAARLKRDVLHRLLVHRHHSCLPQALSDPPSPRPIYELFGPTKNSRTCRICQGPLTYKWSLGVMDNKYVADYCECAHCQALQIPEPFWLDEAYESENEAWMCNPDSGRFIRNFSTYRYLASLQKAGLFPAPAKFLDFAGGYGLLTQMLHSAGHQAWLTDLYVCTPFFASDRYIRNFQAIPAKSFDVVTALEVFEHLTDPRPLVNRLAALLKPEGTLVISTRIYQPGTHDATWGYLGQQWGQHVTFWSKIALKFIAQLTHFTSVAYFPSDEGVLILFSRKPSDVLGPILVKAADLLKDVDHLREAVIAWDLLVQGYFQASSQPFIQDVRSALPDQQAA